MTKLKKFDQNMIMFNNIVYQIKKHDIKSVNMLNIKNIY